MSSIMLSLLVLCIFVQSTQASSVHTHVEAVKRLTAAGIGIFSPGHCIDRSNKECVSLEGIHTEVIDGIIMLKVNLDKIGWSNVFRTLPSVRN
jgi:hypothetical protein